MMWKCQVSLKLPFSKGKFAAFGELAGSLRELTLAGEAKFGEFRGFTFVNIFGPKEPAADPPGTFDLLQHIPALGGTLQSLCVGYPLVETRWKAFASSAFGSFAPELARGRLQNLTFLELDLHNSRSDEDARQLSSGIARTCRLLTHLKLFGTSGNWTLIFNELSTLDRLERLETSAFPSKDDWSALRRVKSLTALFVSIVADHDFVTNSRGVFDRLVAKDLFFVPLYYRDPVLLFSNVGELIVPLIDEYEKRSVRFSRAAACYLAASYAGSESSDAVYRRPQFLEALNSTSPVPNHVYQYVLELAGGGHANFRPPAVDALPLVFMPFLKAGSSFSSVLLSPTLVDLMRDWIKARRPNQSHAAVFALLEMIPDLLTRAEQESILTLLGVV